MSRKLVFYLTNFLRNLDSLLPPMFTQNPALALAGMPSTYKNHSALGDENSQRSLKDIIGDGILWAVPKHRRTVEKRLKRKFGIPDLHWKPLRIKAHLRNCIHCGHDHEAGILCPHCYYRVRKETKQMQEHIQQELGLNPVEQDVIVLYEGERSEQPADSFNGKRIVEIPKPRPMWFTKNLLQKTTQQSSDSKEIKPNDLA